MGRDGEIEADSDADVRELAAAIARRDAADVEAVMSTPAGRRVFNRLFEKGKIWESSMTGNSWTFFNEGGRNLALSFLADAAANPELWSAMMAEARSDPLKSRDAAAPMGKAITQEGDDPYED